jgi:polysaccharide deacetylase 2 family uncharacterized protein YibQ
MNKSLRIILIVILILTPLVLYKYFYKGKKKSITIPLIHKEILVHKPQIALIFDDLGESLKDLKEIYSLQIPVTISVIPGLKFSKNIAYIGSRSGFSVFIHLPLEPIDAEKHKTDKYKFISASLTQREIDSLLRYYLGYLRIAIGVNNHMGSEATRNPKLMKTVLEAIKARGLIFVDSRTSSNSIAYKIAKRENMLCGYNEGFFDSLDSFEAMEKRFNELVERAKKKGKIILVTHPKKSTIELLKKKIPALKEEIEFITIKDYFGL